MLRLSASNVRAYYRLLLDEDRPRADPGRYRVFQWLCCFEVSRSTFTFLSWDPTDHPHLLSIAILRTPLGKPSIQLEEANALIGAMFNADLQLGSALGLAIATAIITQINAEHPAVDGSTTSDFGGYCGAFYFIMGLTAFEALLALFTLRNSASAPALMLPESERKVLDVEGFTVERTGVDSEKSPRNASIPQNKRLTGP